MKKRRWIACCAALALLFTLLTGCGNTGGQSASTGSQPPADNSASSAPEENANAADLVLTGGVVETMVDGAEAEALAVKDGEIVFVGTSADAEAYIGQDTQVIDLEGKMVTPGFIDGHIHVPGPYLTEDTVLNLMEYGADLEAYKKAITEFVEAHPDYDVYLVESMDLKAFPDSKPDNAWLDEICSDKPIQCTDMSNHGNLLNSCAIEMCGITPDTPDPDGGTIYKNDAGELTGYFSDCSDLLTGVPAFEYTEEQYRDAFLAFQEEANSYGITAFDSGGDDISPKLYDQMYQDGVLNLRVNSNFFCDPPLGEEAAQNVIQYIEDNQQYVSDFLNVRQVKFTLDGVPEGKSSYLLEPYAPTAGMDPDYVGTPAADQEQLNTFTALVNAAGYTVQIHSMGDASVQQSMNAFVYSEEQNGKLDVRNKITHANLMTDEDRQRMADHGIIAAMQPLWFYYDPFFSPLEEQMFGPERFASEYHIRDMLDAGIIITGSNDYPVTYDFAPLHAIEAGATQCSPYPGEDEQVDVYTRNADQAVTVYEMLEMYTSNGAYAAFLDDRVGTIEVGKRADLVVLSQNILTCDVKEISDTVVNYTISDGRIVYEQA